MNIKSKFSERPKITKKKSKNIYSVDSNHNHPTSGQLSYVDIKTLMSNKKCLLTIAVGHNGTIYAIKKLKQVDIEKIYEATYDVLKARNEKTDGDTIEAYVVKLLANKEIIEGGTYYEKK